MASGPQLNFDARRKRSVAYISRTCAKSRRKVQVNGVTDCLPDQAQTSKVGYGTMNKIDTNKVK